METTFQEDQTFRQTWLWALLSGSAIIIIFTHAKGLQKFDVSQIVPLIIPASIILLFPFFKLKAEINQKSILYKFSPFHYKYYNIDWI